MELANTLKKTLLNLPVETALETNMSEQYIFVKYGAGSKGEVVGPEAHETDTQARLRAKDLLFSAPTIMDVKMFKLEGMISKVEKAEWQN